MNSLNAAFLKTLSVAEAVFFWAAVLASALLFIQLILSFSWIFQFAVLHRPISLKSISAFLAAGSWCAFLTLKTHHPLWLGILLFLLTGGIVFLLTEFLVRYVKKRVRKSKRFLSRYKGADAITVLTIPPSKKGRGKVTLFLGEDSETVDAVTEEENAIFAGTLVKILLFQEDHVVVCHYEMKKTGEKERAVGKTVQPETGSEMKAE